MMRFTMTVNHKKFLWTLIGVIVLITAWQLGAEYRGNDFYLPGPLKVTKALFGILGESATYKVVFHSLTRLVLTFFIVSFIGIALGLLGGINSYFDAFLRPFVSGLRTTPVISMIVIILILFGQNLMVYITGFLVIFPLLYDSTKEGILNIDKGITDALALEPVHILLKITRQYVPLALPFIKVGLIQSFGLGFKVLVMSEYLAQTKTSIGMMLYEGRIMMEYADVFAWTLIIIVIVFGMETLLGKFKASSQS
jgi:NitT/TauT family transport system permease protein